MFQYNLLVNLHLGCLPPNLTTICCSHTYTQYLTMHCRCTTKQCHSFYWQYAFHCNCPPIKNLRPCQLLHLSFPILFKNNLWIKLTHYLPNLHSHRVNTSPTTAASITGCKYAEKGVSPYPSLVTNFVTPRLPPSSPKHKMQSKQIWFSLKCLWVSSLSHKAKWFVLSYFLPWSIHPWCLCHQAGADSSHGHW